MSMFDSTTSDFITSLQAGDPPHAYDEYDIWFKVAMAVSPQLRHDGVQRVHASVINKLRERFWVANPMLPEGALLGRSLTHNIDVTAFNAYNPYTDILEFYSGSVWTVCTERFVDDVVQGRVPNSEVAPDGWMEHKWGFVDCREDHREGTVNGWMVDPTDAASAPWPGPYQPGPDEHNIKYYQFVTISQHALDEDGQLSANVRTTTQELLETVMEWTRDGRRILFFSKNGVNRCAYPMAVCLAIHMNDPYSFLKRLRPTINPILPGPVDRDTKAPSNMAVCVCGSFMSSALFLQSCLHRMVNGSCHSASKA